MKNLLLSCLLAGASMVSYAQNLCSPTPVVESVRNGDFQAGYLPGKHFVDSSAVGSSHEFVAGETFDFFSALDFAGAWSDTTSVCKYQLANQYAVTRWEAMPCKYEENAISYGFNYIEKGSWYDHTTKTGAGFALLLDFANAEDTVTGLWKTAWGQKINFLPNQEYYFSAWTANFNYSEQSTPTRLRIQFLNENNEVTQDTIIKESVINGGDLAWKQIAQAYTTPSNTSQAIISIEIDPSGLENQDDYVLDDISFINSQQSLAKNTIIAHFEEKEISLCLNNAEVQLTPVVEKEENSNLHYYWYTGDLLEQELLTNTLDQDTLIAQKSGNYRVCIEDTATNSVYNTTIQINTNLPLDLPTNLVLCNPKEHIVDTKYGKDMLNVWDGPNKSDSSSLLIDKVGEYTLYITTLNENQECMKEHTINVTSTLPDVPTNLTYCSGFETELEGVYNNLPWKWFKEQSGLGEIGVGQKVAYTFADTLSGDQILYIQQADNEYVGTLGSDTLTAYPEGKNASTHFITKQNIVIDSIQVLPTPWAGTCFAEGSNVTHTFSIPSLNLEKTVNLTCGEIQTVYLGFAVPTGEYDLVINNGNVLRFHDVTKKEIEGIIEITSEKTSFANWKISSTNACTPLPVTIKEECVITELENTNENQIIVSPNPFDENTTISLNTTSSIVVYDVNGQIVETFNNVNDAVIGTHLTTGIYFVSIQNTNGIFYQKIIKQ